MISNETLIKRTVSTLSSNNSFNSSNNSSSNSTNINNNKNNQQTTFDPNQYSIVYEEFMENEECRQIFLKYLQEHADSEEALCCFNDLILYKKQYEKIIENKKKNSLESYLTLFDNILNIIDKYCLPSSEFELNLNSFTKKDILLKKEQVTNLKKELLNIKEETILENILSLLESNYIFEKIELAVNLDLKLDQFPRFVRSEMLYNFLKKKGKDFIRTIALDISKGYEVDFRYKPQDFSSVPLMDKDIYFALSLAEDSPDWELVNSKTKPFHCEVFVTKTSYIIGKERMEGMKLCKMSITFPFDRDEMLEAFCDRECRKLIDPMLFKINNFNSLNPSKENLACQFGEIFFKLPVPLLKKRYMPYVITAVHDTVLDCIIIVPRTCYPKDENYTVHKDCVVMEAVAGLLFYNLGDNMTRLIYFYYTDSKVPLGSHFVFKKAAKKRASGFSEGFGKAVQLLREKKKKNLEINDFFKLQPTLDENQKFFKNRSWYEELLNKKRLL
ncbi:hypothetical protein ABK040_013448 [Willaertia magna]